MGSVLPTKLFSILHFFNVRVTVGLVMSLNEEPEPQTVTAIKRVEGFESDGTLAIPKINS
jgi:hypothetical protein